MSLPGTPATVLASEFEDRAGYVAKKLSEEFTAPESVVGIRSVVRYRRKNQNRANAAANITTAINRRTSRFLLRVLISLLGRRMSVDCSVGLEPESEDGEAKKRSRHLRQRNASRPRTRCKKSFQRVLLDARTSELPHSGQVMILDEPESELILPPKYLKFAGCRAFACIPGAAGRGMFRERLRMQAPHGLACCWRDR